MAAVGRDDDSCPRFDGPSLRISPEDAHDATRFEKRSADANPFDDRRPGGSDSGDDHRIKHGPTETEPRRRPFRRDFRIDGATARGRDPNPPNRMVADGFDLAEQTQTIEHIMTFRAEKLSAELIARKRRGVEEQDVAPSASESERKRRPGQACAGDDDVMGSFRKHGRRARSRWLERRPDSCDQRKRSNSRQFMCRSRQRISIMGSFGCANGFRQSPSDVGEGSPGCLSTIPFNICIRGRDKGLDVS